MFRNTEYTRLFKELATRHKEIRHTAKECHFLKCILSSDPIQQKVDMTSFYTALKSKAGKGLMLVLISYDADYEDAGDDKTLTHRNGAFMVLEKVRDKDDVHRDEVLDRTERVAHEIMGAVLEQFRSLQARREGRFIHRSNMMMDSIGPVADNHHGTRFGFQFTQPATQALIFNPEAFD